MNWTVGIYAIVGSFYITGTLYFLTYLRGLDRDIIYNPTGLAVLTVLSPFIPPLLVAEAAMTGTIPVPEYMRNKAEQLYPTDDRAPVRRRDHADTDAEAGLGALFDDEDETDDVVLDLDTDSI